jgi:hypothetical protein
LISQSRVKLIAPSFFSVDVKKSLIFLSQHAHREKDVCLFHNDTNDKADNKHKRERRQIKQRLFPLIVYYIFHLPLSPTSPAREYYLEAFISFY